MIPQRVQWIGKGAFIAGAVLFVALVGFLIYLDATLPPVARLENPEFSLPTNIFDRNGVKVDEVFIYRRKLVTYDQLPKQLINGLLAKEDTRFFEHHGIDPVRMLKAAWVNLITFSTAQGASTLTQQTARQFFLTLDKTWIRKISEILLALKMEREFSKEEILTLYLNKVNFGDAWGISAASEYYFDKRVEDLSLAEGATLIGLLPAPNRYKPTRNPILARRQRNIVLQRMFEEGYISQAESLAASSEPIVLAETSNTNSEAAAYYVEYVRRTLLQQLGGRQLYEGGLNVVTAMDFTMQKAAHQALLRGVAAVDKRRGYRGSEDKVELDAKGQPPQEALDALNPNLAVDAGRVARGIVLEVTAARARVALAPKVEGVISWDAIRTRWPVRFNPQNENEPLYNRNLTELLKPGELIQVKGIGRDPASGKLLLDLYQEPVVNGAVYAMDPRTGEVLAMVGGTRFGRGNGASEFIRATQAERQPGSAFKPIIYAAAIDEGYTPATVLDDSPRVFTLANGKKHIPQNYDNTFLGHLTLRESLVRSRNVPTVQLVDEMGPRKVVQYARKLGITTRIPEESLIALGTHSVRLSELTRAYAVFASGGMLSTPVYVLKVTDQKGNVVIENKPSAQQVIAPETAYLVSDMLLDVVRSQYGTGHRVAEVIHRPAAGKTGTTQNYSDAWFMGFIPQLVAGVYVGFDDVSHTLGPSETGSRAALPIWLDFMTRADAGMPIETFAAPPTVVMHRVNSNGQLLGPCDDSAGSRLEMFKASSIPPRLQGSASCGQPGIREQPAQASPGRKEDVNL
jgi:penicillin-binding protein 1A